MAEFSERAVESFELHGTCFKAKFDAAQSPAHFSLSTCNGQASESDADIFGEVLQRVSQTDVQYVLFLDLRELCIITRSTLQQMVTCIAAHYVAEKQLAIAICVHSSLWSRATRQLIGLLISSAPSSLPIIISHQRLLAESFMASQNLLAETNAPEHKELSTASFASCNSTLPLDSFNSPDLPTFVNINIIFVCAAVGSHKIFVSIEELDNDAAVCEQMGNNEQYDSSLLQICQTLVVEELVSQPIDLDALVGEIQGTAQQWAACTMAQEYLASRTMPMSNPVTTALPWIGVRYKLRVRGGYALQWSNRLVKHICHLGELVFEPNCRFRRPSDSQPLSPIKGVELRWRWDARVGSLFIDFYQNGKILRWRWDELRPSSRENVLEVAPDWQGTGHVGQFTFNYLFLRADQGSLLDSASQVSEPGNDSPSNVGFGSFLSCFGEDLQQALQPSSIGLSFSRSSSYGKASDRRVSKQPRQNSNRISQYSWLRNLLESIVKSAALNSVLDTKTQQQGTPLFVVAGSCPNRFCGMQAILYCQLGADIHFWWVKPDSQDPTIVEVNTLNKHHSGSFKNIAEKSQKLYAPLAEKFQGTTDGAFTFSVNSSGRAVIEEACGEEKRTMLVYLIWQESWSGAFARRTFIQGKICYQKDGVSETPSAAGVAADTRFFCRQYRIEDGCMLIAPWEDEELVASLLPSEDFQEMYDMAAMT